MTDIQKKEIAPKHEVSEKYKEETRQLLKNFFNSLDLKTVGAMALYIEKNCNRTESRVNLTKKFARASFKMSEVLEILATSGHTLEIVRKK